MSILIAFLGGMLTLLSPCTLPVIPLLFAMVGIGRDRDLMGRFAIGRNWSVVYAVTTAVVVLCVLTLGVTTILG